MIPRLDKELVAVNRFLRFPACLGVAACLCHRLIGFGQEAVGERGNPKQLS